MIHNSIWGSSDFRRIISRTLFVSNRWKFTWVVFYRLKVAHNYTYKFRKQLKTLSLSADKVLTKTSTTAMEPHHLKVKDTKWEISLTKNYCISINMQKISPILKFFGKIQQILRSHELKSRTHFWPLQPKNNRSNF